MKDFLAGALTMALASLMPTGIFVMVGFILGGENLVACLIAAGATVALSVGSSAATCFIPGSFHRSLFKGKPQHGFPSQKDPTKIRPFSFRATN